MNNIKELTKQSIKEFSIGAGSILRQEMEALLNKLTDAEIEKFATSGENQFPARLAKTLLIAVSKSRALEKEYGAESIKKNVKSAIRINNKRYA